MAKNQEPAVSNDTIRVLGVHPVTAREPCHLIELEVLAPGEQFDMALFTQPLPGRSRSSWQVPYMDRLMNLDGTKAITDLGSVFRNIPEMLSRTMRVVFYFHYLRTSESLESPFGPVLLPDETPIPRRLEFLHYEPVD